MARRRGDSGRAWLRRKRGGGGDGVDFFIDNGPVDHYDDLASRIHDPDGSPMPLPLSRSISDGFPSTDWIHVISVQSLAVTLSSRKVLAMAATRPARVLRYRGTTTRRKASLGRDGATCCHLMRRLVADWFLERWTVNTVTVAGMGTSRSFQDKTIPKFLPPPPQMAQKRSSSMVALSRSLPLASTMVASRTWSEARPCASAASGRSRRR
uniref:Uncharacterized protein n=1 Tax=Oryza nivara TaxID=4536 RepID=A0A0E0IR22_ORYNI